jgi:hypothetical protein
MRRGNIRRVVTRNHDAYRVLSSPYLHSGQVQRLFQA